MERRDRSVVTASKFRLLVFNKLLIALLGNVEDLLLGEFLPFTFERVRNLTVSNLHLGSIRG